MKPFLFTFFAFFCFQQIFAQLPTQAIDISPLLIGEKLPVGNLINSKGETIETEALFTNKPSVVFFYRGGWCPYCTRHLAAIGEIEQEILDLGYQIIAVTGQGLKDLSKTVMDYPVNYTVLSDTKSTWIQEIGIAFKPNERTLGYMLQNSQDQVDEILPVPALFVVDQEGKILFEHINPDYSKRIENKYLLNVLKGLK
ncbi:MAG: AhpC/TSA family protein [Bacteroidetes bacterium]|nr:AhpC/TSA family protein [Bacteroidota bacterium]